MNDLRLNVAILFIILAGGCAGLAWIEGTAGFTSEFARQNHEHLMLAFPALAAICGMVGGFLMGTLMLKPTNATSQARAEG